MIFRTEPDERLCQSDGVQQLSDTADLAHALMRSSGTAIYIVQDRKFQYINHYFQELSDYLEDELLGTEPLNLVHPDDREKVRTNAIMNLKGHYQPTPYEYRLIKKNKQLMWVLERVTSINYRGKPATVGNFLDITRRKQTEDELTLSISKLRKAMDGAVQAIAFIVDQRDPYTASHQRRVARLACAIAQEMNIPESKIDGIQMAASIHDIGKIYVPAEILNRPGTLTECEHQMIREHPRIGYDILKGIEFPYPVAQMVLQHHERLDGSGYPSGLKADEILLESRIIAVADVVEAMASHRPYRPSLGITRAMNKIKANSGTLYEATAVDACVKIFRTKSFKF